MKRVIFSIAVMFFLFTCVVNAQMKSGSFFFDGSTSGYTLNDGSGNRSVQKEVKFDTPFDVKPKVYVSVILYDGANDKNRMRYSAEAVNVSRDGFILKVTTWGDTKVNAIGGNWLAEAEKLELKKEDVKVGQTIQLNNIYFEFNKAQLLPESFPELDKVVDFLKQTPTIEIELSGHTDNVGSDDYNMTLSQKRADAVKDYLVSKGIAANRLQSKGYGKTKPIATNATESGREQNRRVEFTILKK